MTGTTGGTRRRGRLADGNPDPVDVHVGLRMRLRRTLIGMSQEQLAAWLLWRGRPIKVGSGRS